MEARKYYFLQIKLVDLSFIAIIKVFCILIIVYAKLVFTSFVIQLANFKQEFIIIYVATTAIENY